MNILVTGGAGFIGSHTVVELFNTGHSSIILDDFSNSEISVLNGLKTITGETHKLYKGNSCDENLLNKIFSENKIDGVIHFAASKAVGESVEKPLKYYENNIGSLISLMKSMLSNKVTNLVFSSSCTVYGDPDVLPVTENSPIKVANSPYGNTKQICEEIINETCQSKAALKAIALRYFNPIGAHPSALIGELPIGIPSNLIPFVTQTGVGLRDQLSVFGDDYPTSDGSCIRDYIHVVDLAKAHVAALNLLISKDESNFYDTINIGTGQGNTVLEVIKYFEEVSGKSLNYKIVPRRSGDVPAIYGDVTKAKKILNWQTEKTLKQCLEDAWRWQLKISENNIQ